MRKTFFVKINLNNKDKLLIALIYRSSSNTDLEHGNDLRELIRECYNLNHTHILNMGDFNYPDSNWKNWSIENYSSENECTKFLETIQDLCLEQHITKPTR